MTNKNKSGSWKYGYDSKYDVVIISKTGQIGEVVSIQGLPIALPKPPKECPQRHSKKSEQYWERVDIPKELSKIQSIFQWNEQHAVFKNRWVDYIEEEFNNQFNEEVFMPLIKTAITVIFFAVVLDYTFQLTEAIDVLTN